jgi:hypothetical protein
LIRIDGKPRPALRDARNAPCRNEGLSSYAADSNGGRVAPRFVPADGSLGFHYPAFAGRLFDARDAIGAPVVIWRRSDLGDRQPFPST